MENPSNNAWDMVIPFRDMIRGGFRLFELQVLVFPLLVVVLACVSFLWGGQCAAWQWWASVTVVVGVPFLKQGVWKAALGAAGLFVGLLIILKGALPPVLWDNAYGVDTCLYHFPMMQLLAEGWNPVADPFAEGITEQLGLDLWGMAPTLVAYFNKTMAVFAAVSYKFVGDPTSMTIPGLALLWLSCAMQAMRARTGVARWVALTAAVMVLPIMCRQIFVDLSLAFAACGLLFTMERDLRRNGCDWLHLFVYTVWMMNLKLNGVLGAFVFWVLFAMVKTWRGRADWKRWIGRFVLFGTGVTLMWGVISWNPLITSLQKYGHPLYPFKTADAEKRPAQDPSWDIRLINDDFQQMGKVGIWLYEYVSPRMVKAYYRRKTGKGEFNPQRTWVPDESFVHGRGWIRPVLWLLFLVLFAHPKGRLFGLGGLLLTGLVPWDKIGYTRYEPWLSSLGCLALTLGSEWVEGKSGAIARRGLTVAAAFALASGGGAWIWIHARDIEFKAKELQLVRPQVRCRFWKATDHSPSDVNDPYDFVPRYNYLTAMENHSRLLVKQLGWEKTEVCGAGGWRSYHEAKSGIVTNRPAWTLDERQWFVEEEFRDERNVADLDAAWFPGNIWDGITHFGDAEAWVMTPWKYYFVRLGERTEHIGEYYRGGEPVDVLSASQRVYRNVRGLAHTWSVTYPREVWRWLTKWQKTNPSCQKEERT